ncbi:hypothetical protein NM688_g6157 [Phlebia brevispora]|uniref:Uncharacterized protein n=1 Tax=Phlebia brevispora TaxID=194682 RepID=A0ACC1SJC7_9APHY|nr:hypothetical protein NM688_g6157 [Phlebia brevispora]
MVAIASSSTLCLSVKVCGLDDLDIIFKLRSDGRVVTDTSDGVLTLLSESLRASLAHRASESGLRDRLTMVALASDSLPGDQDMPRDIMLDDLDRELLSLVDTSTPATPRNQPSVLPVTLSPGSPSECPSTPAISLATISRDASPAPSEFLDNTEMRFEQLEGPVLYRLPRFPPSNGAITFMDGLVGCETQDGKYIITSPNMDFIPQPVYGEVTIVRQWNGHFGVYDPVMWPQLYIEQSRFRWLMAIARMPTDPRSPYMPIWRPLVTDDLKAAPNSVTRSFFVVNEARQDDLRPLVINMSLRAERFMQQNEKQLELESLVASMKGALQRLAFPSSQADLVRQYSCVQRYWLMIDAWIEFHVHVFKIYKFFDPFIRRRPTVRTDLMGAFTNRPHVASHMFNAGVPVWFMRFPDQMTGREAIRDIVNLTPANFRMDSGLFPNTPIFQGWAGEKHMIAIATHAHAYKDLDIVPHDEVAPQTRQLVATRVIAPTAVQAITSVVPGPSSSVDRIPHSTNSRHEPYSKPKAKKAKTKAKVKAKAKAKAKAHNQKKQSTEQKDQDMEQMDVDVPKGDQNTEAAEMTRAAAEKIPKTGLTRTKFEDLSHPIWPPCIPAWQSALSRIDQSQTVVPHHAVWQYWVPDAAIFVSTGAEGRLEQYLTNWLRARDNWFWILDHEAMAKKSVRPLRPQEWRDYLNMTEFKPDSLEKATKSSERRREVYRLFQRALGVDKVFEETAQEYQWYNEKWVPSSSQQGCEILWELCEVGFRCELTELDRHLVPNNALDTDVFEHVENFRRGRIQKVFGGRPLVLNTLPLRNEGLAASDIRDRVDSLEALRAIMHRWPDVPEHIKLLPPLTVAISADELARIEVIMCLHYTQRFYNIAGRAPTLPRRLKDI